MYIMFASVFYKLNFVIWIQNAAEYVLEAEHREGEVSGGRSIGNPALPGIGQTARESSTW